jgi:CHAD domain-containing protein
VSLAGLAAAEFRRLRRRRRSLGTEPTDQGLHDLRLLLKRARYAAELAEAEVGAGAKALIRQAKALQDILGEHQDATVTEQRVREMLRRPQSVRYAVAAGRLIERQHMRREQARSAFPAAWKALERQARATWP